jgi:hypothetical protein
MKIAIWILLVAAVIGSNRVALAADAGAALDLIDRRVVREPAYESTPKYL